MVAENHKPHFSEAKILINIDINKYYQEKNRNISN